jgi:putative membrane protein
MRRQRVRIAVILSALGGVAVALALVAWFGAGSVLKALEAIGWRGLLILIALHLVLMVLCAIAWRAVMPATQRMAFRWALAARLLRDAGSELLPISAAGGAVMGVRALALARVPTGMAFAATIVDITTELVGQLGFTALGIAALLHAGLAPELARDALIGFVVAIALLVAFVAAQRLGFFEVLEEFSARLAAHETGLPPGETGLQAAIGEIHRNHAGVMVAIGAHFVAWCGTVIEAWVTLKLIGAPLPLVAVLLIESMTYAIRSAIFFVPSGWGVQEGGYVALGALVGLAPGPALALSLSKRAREIAIGLPVLLAWQALEARRLRRASA